MRHALVLERSGFVACHLEELLQAAGFESVDIAATQAQAIRLAKARCPDLIAAKGKLENGSAVEAIRHICREKAIPVIFVVAEAQNIEGELPNAHLLVEPVSESSLFRAIKTISKNPLLFE